MKDLESLEELIRKFSKSRQAEIRTTPEFDRRVLGSASSVLQETMRNSVPKRFNMRIIGLATAAILFGVLLLAGTYLKFSNQNAKDSDHEVTLNADKIDLSNRIQSPSIYSLEGQPDASVSHMPDKLADHDVRVFTSQLPTFDENIPMEDLPKLPTHTKKASINKDWIYFLPIGSASIFEYSLTNDATQYFNISANGIVPLMGDVSDFIVDSKGNLHILAFLMPMKESGIIRYNRTTAQYSCLYLNKPIYAYHLDLDSRGNYYLLGFEPGLERSWANGQSVPEMTNIVHKYSPDGRYITSFLPVHTPASEDEFTDLFSLINDRNNFAVLPNGDVYFYQHEMLADPPWNAKGMIHIIDGQNYSSTLVEPIVPENCYLRGIHKYQGQIAYDWAKLGDVLSKFLTLEDGTNIIPLPKSGQVYALNDDIIAMQIIDREANNIYISIISMP